ncbi:MAG: hypothetical protein FWB88_03175 [Defluviitaleaceae bacterium]|nr:hypothetical protein [Defluviitaleaceae bacterium]MCL2238448.1 hypothetical protein [Defluviitaleaceae bacterium]
MNKHDMPLELLMPKNKIKTKIEEGVQMDKYTQLYDILQSSWKQRG